MRPPAMPPLIEPNYILSIRSLDDITTAQFMYTLPDLAIKQQTSATLIAEGANGDVDNNELTEDIPVLSESQNTSLKPALRKAEDDTSNPIDEMYLIARAWNALHACNDTYVRVHTGGSDKNPEYKVLKTDDSNIVDGQIKDMLRRIRQILRPKSSEDPR